MSVKKLKLKRAEARAMANLYRAKSRAICDLYQQDLKNRLWREGQKYDVLAKAYDIELTDG